MLGISARDFKRLIGMNDVAAADLLHFAKGHDCIDAREGGASIDGRGESKGEFRLEKTSLAPPNRFGARDAVVGSRSVRGEPLQRPSVPVIYPSDAIQRWIRCFSLVHLRSTMTTPQEWGPRVPRHRAAERKDG